jgi:putative ABC transport system ATP-binding protein
MHREQWRAPRMATAVFRRTVPQVRPTAPRQCLGRISFATNMRGARWAPGSHQPSTTMSALPIDTPIISLRDVSRVYAGPSGGFAALSSVSLDIAAGAFVAMIGQSGSGKSTLLSLISGVDHPTSGEVHVGGTAVHALTERELPAWRGRRIGIVFQFFQLLPTLTAAENVMLPMDFCDTWTASERPERARALLDRLGVADQADKFPSTLSGGQQQRVAIARALANAPAVLLADEPTGNLDSRTAVAILDLFAGLSAEGQTVVMVTHEQGASRHATQTVTLADGRIVSPEALAIA